MARTATPDEVKIQGIPVELSNVGSLTFRTADERPLPPYHFMLRTVGPNTLPDGTITGDMLDLDVIKWLEMGYSLLQVDLMGSNKGAGGEFLGNVLGYHFVLK